jgi:hypothetical protein
VRFALFRPSGSLKGFIMMTKQQAIDSGFTCVIEQKNLLTNKWERDYAPQTLFKNTTHADACIRRMQAGWSDSVREMIELRISDI